MELYRKLKKLRTARGLTQANAAEYLNVSPQTVSRWERGLLSPDISLLPKLALLYRCSIDTLFDMETVWGDEHRRETEETVNRLAANSDWEGIYQVWLHEIEMRPDCFSDYPRVMSIVLRKSLLDDDHTERMLSLAVYAERNCMDDEIRNEIFRLMLGICAKSSVPAIKEKAQYYYRKLPLLKHSREVYCRSALSGDEYLAQIKKNIFYLVDICECAIRQMISDNMSAEEQLYYYQKAASLYETVLDGKYGGLYDIPLLQDYCKIAELSEKTGQHNQAEMYIDRIIFMIKRHLSADDKTNISVFLSEDAFTQKQRAENNIRWMLKFMLQNESFIRFRDKIVQLSGKYFEYPKNNE